MYYEAERQRDDLESVSWIQATGRFNRVRWNSPKCPNGSLLETSRRYDFNETRIAALYVGVVGARPRETRRRLQPRPVPNLGNSASPETLVEERLGGFSLSHKVSIARVLCCFAVVFFFFSEQGGSPLQSRLYLSRSSAGTVTSARCGPSARNSSWRSRQRSSRATSRPPERSTWTHPPHAPARVVSLCGLGGVIGSVI